MRTNNKTRPPLKWAGNKYLIVERILKELPDGDRLIEPFSGSAALFLNSDFKRYTINDKNTDLISFYKILKKQGVEFIRYANQFFEKKYNNAEAFYSLREEFNETQDLVKKPALFLYINRHGYNGLCRYNAAGKLNVPFGRYAKPYFPEKELLAMAAKFKTAKLQNTDFEIVLNNTKAGEVVYCDPPYVPLSKTSNFTSYASGGFNDEDQKRLVSAVKRACERNVFIIISNHETPFTKEIYRDAKQKKMQVRRTISCKAKKRKLVKELLAIYANT